MSYHIYTTKGVILSERPLKEADRLYTILTRDLGVIRAIAVGVRKERSKLRGCIEPFSISHVSLVRGREYWRLTNAVPIRDLPSQLRDQPEIFLLLVKNLSLLEKLVAGEESHPKLFSDIEAIIDFVSEHDIDADKIEPVEVLLATKILFNLGYISKSDVSAQILEDKPTHETLSSVLRGRDSIIQAVNEGIQASHLT